MLTRNPAAKQYVRIWNFEVVEFTKKSGVFRAANTILPYSAGDVIILNSLGDYKVIESNLFLIAYAKDKNTGKWERKVNPPILALQIVEKTMCVKTKDSEDTLEGKAGDWLIQYGPSDYGFVSNDFFMKAYKEL